MNTAIKWHGGKAYLADWIISHFPARCTEPNSPKFNDGGWLNYVEPYFGGGSVLLRNDPTGISEVANDVDGALTNFWRVLQDPVAFHELRHRLNLTPFSQVEFEAADRDKALVIGADPVDAALQFFVRCRQSRQGLGKCFATLSRNRTRQGMNEQVSSWLSAIDGLPEIHARLRRVVILNQDALKTIKQQDGPRTLFYCDPPYVHDTRAKSATDAYQHEMTKSQHTELLYTLAAIKGRFLLSGYPSELYHDFANEKGWRCVTKEIDNKSSGAKVKEKKTECLWMNY